MEPVLKISQLQKTYGKVEAVKDVSFEVGPNEIFALIGPNGAGKSTTLRIIATLLSPTAGEVTLGGARLSQDPAKIREQISYLPEEAGAYKNLRGIDYLRFMATLLANDPHQAQKMVEFASELTSLGDRLKDKASTYSKGMTRKLLLARTVMHRPRLAILDEPTSGLDVLNAFEIRKTIKRMAGEGMSVLLSSHNMLEVEYLSDRVGLIDHGQLLEVGSAEALKQKYAARNLEEVFVGMTSQKAVRP